MKLYSTILNPAVNSQNISDGLLPYFPWVNPWMVKVSGGLTNPLGNLLVDIEEILGHEPQIDFLRIIEEPDQEEEFVRKLCIFVNPVETSNSAKGAALLFAKNKAISHSKTMCYKCGSPLFKGEYHESDERLVDQYVLDHGIEEYKAQFMQICLHCIKKFYGASSTVEEAEKVHLSDHNQTIEISESKITYEEQSDFLKTEDQSIKGEMKNKLNHHVESSNMITLFNLNDIDQLEKDYEGATRDQANRVKNLVKRIRKNTAKKRLASIPESWQQYCDKLECSFPNFAEVTRFIRNQLALSEISNQVLRIPPFLLVGDAGIGKTEFMLTLAHHFNTKLEVVDISNSQSGSVLAGSENYWGNSKPGLLFNTLVFGDVANPIIMLDEVDKAHTDSAYRPLAALHSLLEARQASQFQDLSVPEIKIDASNVIWIATANKIELIDKPLIDRFTVFNIDTPTANQMQGIVRNQYKRFLEKSPAGSYFEKEISSKVVDELCLYHPRNVRKMLDLSFGLAASQQRNRLTVKDIRESKIKDDNKQSRGIGFMSEGI